MPIQEFKNLVDVNLAVRVRVDQGEQLADEVQGFGLGQPLVGVPVQLVIEVVDRSWKADEVNAQSFRQSCLSVPISVPHTEHIQEKVVFKRDSPIVVGVKEVKELVQDAQSFRQSCLSV